MKQLLLILPIFALAASPVYAETIRLNCKTELSETDPSVKPQYDVTVTILADGAILTIDGQEFTLDQENDAGISFSRWDPWYRFTIGDRKLAPNHKYALGIPTNESFARYTLCEEVQ